LKITHFSETTKDRNLIFGMSVDAIYIYDQGDRVNEDNSQNMYIFYKKKNMILQENNYRLI
jgi:hypothetical protein